MHVAKFSSSNYMYDNIMGCLHYILYSRKEVLVGIKFGDWAPNCHCKNTGGFKFGGVVRHCHTYIGKYEVLADFYLVVVLMVS